MTEIADSLEKLQQYTIYLGNGNGDCATVTTSPMPYITDVQRCFEGFFSCMLAHGFVLGHTAGELAEKVTEIVFES